MLSWRMRGLIKRGGDAKSVLILGEATLWLSLLIFIAGCAGAQPQNGLGELGEVARTNESAAPRPRTLADFTALRLNDEGGLSECTDFRIVGEAEDEAEAKALAEALAADLDSDKMLLSPCEDELSEHAPLARCETRFRRHADDRLEFQIVAYYFDLSDVYERNDRRDECLETGGEWSAMPREA